MTANWGTRGGLSPGSGRPSAAPAGLYRRIHSRRRTPGPKRDLIHSGNHESGHSYKVRLFLALAGVPHRYVWVDLDVPRSARPEEFRRPSQFGEVPVLVAHGVPRDQSNAILLRSARETGKLGPPAGSSWEQLTAWLNRVGFSMANLRWCRRGFETAPAGALSWIGSGPLYALMAR